MKTIPVTLQLAKIFYSEFHRTNKPPVGHKKSYVGLVGDQWTACSKLFYLEDLPNEWLEDKNYDFRIRLDDDGDCHEAVYALAMAGIEEDWWEHDDLASLPPRDKHAAKAMAATSMMDGMMDEIMSMFSADDGPDEGWFL